MPRSCPWHESLILTIFTFADFRTNIALYQTGERTRESVQGIQSYKTNDIDLLALIPKSNVILIVTPHTKN